MSNTVKNKRRTRQETEHEGGSMERREHTSMGAHHTQSRSSADDTRMGLATTEWDYQKVKEVVSAVYTLASLFLNETQKRRIDKIHADAAAVLGVRSLADWTPPQPLLNIMGLSAGNQGYSQAA